MGKKKFKVNPNLKECWYCKHFRIAGGCEFKRRVDPNGRIIADNKVTTYSCAYFSKDIIAEKVHRVLERIGYGK